MNSSKTQIVKKIYANGQVEDVDEKMTLKQMQEFVGGYIERVPTRFAHRVLYVNEDGLNQELPHNVYATTFVRPGTMVLDFIRGNALLAKG